MLYTWAIMVSVTVFAQLSSVESQGTVDPVEQECFMPYANLDVAREQYKGLPGNRGTPGFNIRGAAYKFMMIRRILANKNNSDYVRNMKKNITESMSYVKTSIEVIPMKPYKALETYLISSPVAILVPFGYVNTTIKGIAVLSYDPFYQKYIDAVGENDVDYVYEDEYVDEPNDTNGIDINSSGINKNETLPAIIGSGKEDGAVLTTHTASGSGSQGEVEDDAGDEETSDYSDDHDVPATNSEGDDVAEEVSGGKGTNNDDVDNGENSEDDVDNGDDGLAVSEAENGDVPSNPTDPGSGSGEGEEDAGDEKNSDDYEEYDDDDDDVEVDSRSKGDDVVGGMDGGEGKDGGADGNEEDLVDDKKIVDADTGSGSGSNDEDDTPESDSDTIEEDTDDYVSDND